MKTFIFATNNKHKLLEARQILGAGIRLQSLEDLGCTENIPETGATLEQNSLLKAEFVWKKYGLPCFADDTGLEVQALGGVPGVYSARYAGENGNHKENVKLLLKNMEGVTDRSAQFRTVVTLILEDGMRQFEGIVRGTIAEKPRGNEGFGYDPVFVPEGYAVSFAEMPAELKNRLSHRAEALQKLADFLRVRIS